MDITIFEEDCEMTENRMREYFRNDHDRPNWDCVCILATTLSNHFGGDSFSVSPRSARNITKNVDYEIDGRGDAIMNRFDTNSFILDTLIEFCASFEGRKFSITETE